MSFHRRHLVMFSILLLSVACTTPAPAPTPAATQAAIDCGFDTELLFSDTQQRPTPLRDVARAPVCAELFHQTEGFRIRILPEEEGNKLIQEIWSLESLRDRVDLRDSNAFWGTLLGKERLQNALENGIHPIDVFGEATSRNWRMAFRRLDEIPVGKLKITPDIISQVNREILRDTTLAARLEITDVLTSETAKNRSETWRKINAWFQGLERYVVINGGRYRTRRLSHNYLTKAMPEEEFQHLKKTESLHGMTFWEAPWSGSGRRYGLVRYPPLEFKRKKFAELIEQTNNEMEEIRAGRSNKDPIALAAEFQWKFVALHPMTNGNGRTSRALMNRILHEFGFPPSLRSDIGLDYGLPIERHIEYVREGVINYIDQFATEESISAGIYGRGYGTRLSSADLAKLAGQVIPRELLVTPRNARRSEPGYDRFDLIPSSLKQIVRIGGKDFTWGDDMLMLHDSHRIPHVARRNSAGWKLYPIPERTYAFYSQGGPLNGQRLVKRDLSAAARDQGYLNAKFFSGVHSGEIKLENVSVEPTSRIADARNSDDVYIYPWQMPVVLTALSIKEDLSTHTPLEILIRNRGDNADNPRLGRTALERKFFENKREIDAGEIMGHYMHMYLSFEKTRRSILKINEGSVAEGRDRLLAEIDASQAKMHAAAKKLLEPFVEKVAEARRNPQAMEYLRQHPEFRLMWEFYTRSPLFHQTIGHAWRAGHRDVVTVVRSASRGDVNIFGFMSDAQKRAYFYKYPWFGRFVESFLKDLQVYVRQITNSGKIDVDPTANYDFGEKMAQKYAGRVAESKNLKAAMDALLKYTLVHPHEYRSIDEETAGRFVVDFLHAQLDLGPKQRLSTTVNPIYVLRFKEKDNNYAPKFAMANPTVYMIQVPIEAVSVDNASRFVVQDEIRINTINWAPAARRSTVWSMAADENSRFPLPEGPAPAEAQAVMDAIQTIPSGLGVRPVKPEEPKTPDAADVRKPTRSLSYVRDEFYAQRMSA